MMNKRVITLCLIFIQSVLTIAAINDNKFIEENISFITQQTKKLLKYTGKPTGRNYPRSIADDGSIVAVDMYDWTSGFFPGSLWYIYELTGDRFWKIKAREWTASLELLKYFTGHHDLGFMMYCSYGNALRLSPHSKDEEIIVESAKSLISRYNENTQTIKSWDSAKSWDGTVWNFPVIADNMMNLELLFAASKLTSDRKFYDIAIKHAEKTIQNHIREDYSTYHVVNYDTITGNVISMATCQGYSDKSTWARGQAWIIYGYTMMYRETNDPRYLDVAVKTADFFIDKLSDDLIPLWDFNANEEGYTPGINSKALHHSKRIKDASAGAVMCSALFELDSFRKDKGYLDLAARMLKELSSDRYRVNLQKDAAFLLKHSVGSIPHGFEVDKPIIYADYYFLEALVRYKRIIAASVVH